MQGPTMPPGEFKAHCLRLLDAVAASGEALTITKRGRPVARLVPLPAPQVLFGALTGSVHGDPADRLVVATARALGATLITAAAALLAYGGLGHVAVLAAR